MTRNFRVSPIMSPRDRYVAFAFASADILLEMNKQGEILYIDGAINGLLGQSPEMLVGHSFLELVEPEHAASVQDLLERSIELVRIDAQKIGLRTRDAEYLPFCMQGFRIPYLEDHYFFTLSLMRDEVAPEEIGKRDLKSGLLRTDVFAKRAVSRIQAAQQEGKPVKMTLLDFPDLTSLLDSLTPDNARSLLKEIGDYLKKYSLDKDSAGQFGEHGYTLIHDGTVDSEKLKEGIREITRKLDPKGKGLELKSKTLDMNMDGLTEQDTANAVLYTLNKFAAESGEDFCIFSLTEGYQDMLQQTVEKISQFKSTVQQDSFDLAFQPIVDLKNGMVHHFEALARLHDNSVFANPFQFVTFGEDTGVIGDFDLAVCQKMLNTLEEADGHGKRPMVSINVSGKSLNSNLFRDAMNGIMKRHEPHRNQVILEVTESAKIHDLQSTNNFLQDLRKEGHLCCLDDFGVGESSFDYIRNLQVDFVKIDGSYVRESTSSQRGRHLLRAMVTMCRELNIVTIGEMVEDKELADLLWECGVRFGQGYYFGKPTIGLDTLIHSSPQTPHHHGAIKARKLTDEQKQRWLNKE